MDTLNICIKIIFKLAVQFQTMNEKECLHAVGQGAIGVECREGDEASLKIIDALNHKATVLACIAERAFLCSLEGGCSAPVAAHAQVNDDGSIRMEGGVWSLDGKTEMREILEVTLTDTAAGAKKAKTEDVQFSSFVSRTIPQTVLETAEKLGLDLAAKLLGRGAKKVLDEAKALSAASS